MAGFFNVVLLTSFAYTVDASKKVVTMNTLVVGLADVVLQNRDAAGAAGCASCLGGCGFIGFFIVAIIALDIALLVWVARDAKSRGMDSAVLWMILVMFTSVIGLIIYLSARPQGNIVSCAHCNNKRLQASAKCPHCGNS
jgi:hypothetical protein